MINLAQHLTAKWYRDGDITAGQAIAIVAALEQYVPRDDDVRKYGTFHIDGLHELIRNGPPLG